MYIYLEYTKDVPLLVKEKILYASSVLSSSIIPTIIEFEILEIVHFLFGSFILTLVSSYGIFPSKFKFDEEIENKPSK